MVSAQKFISSKITQAVIFGIITLFISTTIYAEDNQNGAITGEHLPPPKINTRLGRINTKIATSEARLTILTMDWRAKIASAEAKLKLKLRTFRNKNKADITQRVSTNLNNINQNQTGQMLQNLDNMTKILDKLEVITNKINPGLTNSLIASTRQSIATTSAAVTDQSQKDYTIQVFSEVTVKSDAQTKRNQLFKDLMTVRKNVIDVKQSLYKVFRDIKPGSGIKEGSNSATNQ